MAERSAIELFRKYQPRFRRIRWGISTGWFTRSEGQERDYETCYLFPLHRG